MTTAATLELIVDSTSVGPAERALDRLAATGAKVEGRLTVDMGNIEKAMAQLAQGMGRLDKTITAGFQRMAPAAAPAVRTFDDLRRAIDPAYAAAQRMAQVSDEVRAAAQREGVAVGQVNGLLEIAASRYLGIATAAEQAEQAQREQAAATASATQNYEALRASVDPLYAASRRYESALETLNAAQKAGVLSDQQRQRTLDLLEAQMIQTGAASTVAAAGVGRFTPAITNASFQVQDFAVQVASGQSALIAFTQQLPQLASVMGFSGKLALWGAGLGTIVAVGAAVAPMLMNMGSSADRAQEAIDDLSDAIARYAEYQEVARQSNAAAAIQFGIMAAEGSRASQVLATLARLDAIDAMSAAVDALALSFGGLSREANSGLVNGERMTAFAEATLRAADNLGIAHGQALAVTSALEQMALAEGFDAQIIAADRFNATLISVFGALENVPKELREAARQAAILAATAAETADAITAAERERVAAAEALIADYEQQASLSRAIAESGEDSARVEAIKRAQAAMAAQAYIDQNNLTGQIARDLMTAAMAAYDAKVQADAVAAALAATEARAQALAANLGIAPEAAARIVAMINALNPALAAAAGLAGQLTANLGGAGSALMRVAAALPGAEVVGGILGAGQNVIGSLMGIGEDLIDVAAAGYEAAQGLEVVTGSAGRAGGAASAASQELERLRQAAESLKDGLDPMRAYNRELADLQAMLENGFIDGDQMARAIRNMNIELADTIPMVGSLSDAFGDFVASGFRDWRGFMDAILSTWRSTIASLVSDWARSGLVRILNPGAASATGATGGALGGVAGQALSGIFGSFGTGQGLAGLAGGTGLLGGLGEVIGGLGSGGLSGAFAGLQTALGGGFMSAIGGLIPVVGAAALVISAFRAKTRLLDEGLQVTVSGMDALVESFRRTETSRLFGLVRSQSTSTRAAPAAMADPIIAAVAGIQTGVLEAAQALGVGAAAFDGFSSSIRVSTRGMTDDEAAAAVTEALSGLGDEFALMTPGLRALIRDGETATGALTRLTTALAAVNDAADLLGHALLPTSLAGGNLASVMAEAAGGLDAFGRGVTAYFDGFYTAEERLVAQTRRLSVQMADLGLAMPRSRAEFRRMVEGIDTTTEAGAALYGQVMALAGALDGVLPSIAGLTAELAALQGNAQTGLDAAIEAAKSAAQANAAAATDWYRAAGSIREYIDRLRGTAGALTSGAQAMAYNQARYQTTLAAALAGDLKAAQDITDVAETMRQSSLATARTRVGAARTEARILSDLGLLSGVSDIEGARHDVIAGLLGQQVEVMQGARDAIASGAAMTEAQIDALMGQLGSLDDAIAAAELINYAYLRERLAVTVDILADANVPAYLRTLLSNAATGVEGHIDFIVRSSLTPDQRWLALTGASEHVKTIRYLADNRLGLNLTRVAVDTIGTLTKTVNLAVGARLPADVMRLALAGNSELARTVTATLSASIPADAKRLALGNVGAYSVAVMASLSPGVSADVRRIVVAQQGTYAAAITAAISQQMPTEARRILLAQQGGYIANVTGILVSSMTAPVRTLLLNANTAAMRAVTITAAFSDSLTAEQRLALSASATTTMRTIRAAIDLAGLSATGALFLAQIGVGAATVQKTVAGQIALAALSADQRLLLSSITETVQRSVAFRATGVATADQMRLLGAVSATILRAVDFRATGALTADQRAVLGAVSGSVARLLALSATGTLTRDQQVMLAAASGAVSRSLSLTTAGTLTDDQRRVLLSTAGAIVRSLALTTTGSLSTDQRSVLMASAAAISRSLALTTTGSLTADQRQALTAAGARVDRLLALAVSGALNADQRAILGAVGATVTRTVRAAFDLSALDSGNVTGRRNLLNAANLGFSSTVIGMADLRALTGDGLALLRAATGTIIRTLRGDVDMSGLTPRQRALLDAITGGAEGRITLGGTFQFDPTTGFRTWFETSSRESIARPMNDLRDAMTPLRAALVALKDALAAEAGRAAQAQRVAALNSYAAGMTRDAAGNLYANDQQLSALAGIAGIGTAGLSGQQIGNRVASFSAMDALAGIAYDPTGSRARIEAARARVAALYGQITDLMDAHNVTFDGGLSLTSKGALRYKGGAHFQGPAGVTLDDRHPFAMAAFPWAGGSLWTDLLAANSALRSIPGFAAGGDHVGGLRIVGENGPELEATGPARIWSAPQTRQMLGGGNAEMVAEMRALRAEVNSLREEQRQLGMQTAGHTKRAADMLRKFDIDGLPPERV